MCDVVSGRKTAVLCNILDGSTISHQPALLATASVVLAIELGETPLVGSHDLLSSRELELGSSQSLNDVVGVGVLGADGNDDLADSDTGSHLHGLTVRTSHTGRQTICTGARKHLVLTDDVERVGTASDVVAFFASVLHQVLVAGNASSLKSTGSQLLLLVRDKVGNERELINRSLLGSAIINSDLSIRDTAAKAGLDVRLVLLETNATSRS